MAPIDTCPTATIRPELTADRRERQRQIITTIRKLGAASCRTCEGYIDCPLAQAIQTDMYDVEAHSAAQRECGSSGSDTRFVDSIRARIAEQPTDAA